MYTFNQTPPPPYLCTYFMWAVYCELWAWHFIHTSWTLQCVCRSLIFQILERSHWWSLNLRMFGKGLQVKTTVLLIFFQWLVQSLKNSKIIDYIEKCGLFSNFQHGFGSSWSSADVLTVVSDRIARAFNRSGAARAEALDISKAFDRVWNAALLHRLKSNVTATGLEPQSLSSYTNTQPFSQT